MTGLDHQFVFDTAAHTLESEGIDPEQFLTLTKTYKGEFQGELNLPEKECLIVVYGELCSPSLVKEAEHHFKSWRDQDLIESQDTAFMDFLNQDRKPTKQATSNVVKLNCR